LAPASTAPPPTCSEREPPLPPPDFTIDVSPWISVTTSGGTPSRSATICAYDVHSPVPIDCVPDTTVTRPSPLTVTSTASVRFALPVTST
jgi:hypothetical protein